MGRKKIAPEWEGHRGLDRTDDSFLRPQGQKPNNAG